MPSDPDRDHDLLVILNTKMDMLLVNDVDKERRLRAVERKQWWLAGVSSAVGYGVSVLLQATGKG